jgi:hypothetical protein
MGSFAIDLLGVAPSTLDLGQILDGRIRELRTADVRQGPPPQHLLRLPASRRTPPRGHPVSILTPECPLLTTLGDFFNSHLLGPDRVAFLAARSSELEDDTAANHTTRLATIERQIADISLRQERLLRQAEEAEPNDPFAAPPTGLTSPRKSRQTHSATCKDRWPKLRRSVTCPRRGTQNMGNKGWRR